MKRDRFIEKITEEIKTFGENMKNLGHEEKTPEQWMSMYLNWTEWTTDMHDICWKETEI